MELTPAPASDIASIHDYGDSGFLVFADHASNRIPAKFRDLGLPEDMLKTHIAWDLGARDLALELGQRLAATVLTCEFSRLLIDSNRDPSVKDSIPATSDQIPVPGNQLLSEAGRAERIGQYFDPYHEILESKVVECQSKPAPFVVSVHSFTKRMMGAVEDRPWDVGLLWREDADSALGMIDWLREHSSWVVGDNQPYDARQFNYSVDRHVGPKGLRHLTFEVRQDHLATPEQVHEAGAILAAAIKHIAKAGD